MSEQTTMWPVPRCRTCGCPLLVWLHPRQVAEALQVSRQHVYRLVRRGDLDGRDLGGVRRVSHRSVHRCLDEGAPDPDWWVVMEGLDA